MTSSRFTFAILALATIVTVVIIWVTGCPWTGTSGTPKNIDDRPTIILVYTDDLDCETLFDDWQSTGDPGTAGQEVRFPTIKAMADEGIVFTNFHVTTPVCGPSRACLLSGQYAHRNGIFVNQPGEKSSNGFPGGYGNYDPKTEFANNVKNAGYQTCFVGKYVHDGFVPDKDKNQTWKSIRPPGWEIFQASLGSKYLDFHCVDAVTGKVTVVNDEYRTDFETDRVLDILDQWDNSGRAQMICWLSLAPHDDAESDHNSAARHRDLYSDSTPPSLGRNTDFRDLNLPRELSSLPETLPEEYRKEITRLWHARLRATKALDEGLARIRQRLREQGRLENTIFVLTSDHGFRLGEHGHIGKRLPYDRITRVPTIICGRGVKHGTSHELLTNVDLAPTLIELACPPDFVDDQTRDGRSFASLFGDPEGRLAPPREGVTLENWEYDVSFGNRLPATWAAWRMPDSVYTEWATGGREFYNLKTDPEQRNNLIATMTPEELSRYSDQLRTSRSSTNRPILAQIMTTTGLDFSEAQNGNFEPVLLDGFADADGGVEQVELELHCPTNNQYWTGSGWSVERQRVSATLGNAGGLQSSWQYPIDTSTFLEGTPKFPSGSESTAKPATAKPPTAESFKLQVSLFVTDGKGQSATWSSPQSLRLNDRDPDTWINPQSNPDSHEQSIRLTGRAADETRVRNVRIIINDKVTGKFWNGTDWVTDYETVDAVMTETDDPRFVEWHYEFELNNNHRIYFGARAVDDERNFDRTVSWFEISGSFKPAAVE